MQPPENRSIDAIIAFVEREAERIRARNPEVTPAQLPSSEIMAFLRRGPSQQMPPLRLQESFLARPEKSYHANDLLRFHGEAFVRAAYLACLGREPDGEGFASFRNQLFGGVDKQVILAHIALSAEAKAYGSTVTGLTGGKARAMLRKVPVVGYLVEWLWTLSKLPTLVRRINASEAYAASQDQRLADYANSIANRR